MLLPRRQESQQASLVLPAERDGPVSPEPRRGELDRLAPVKDGLDNVRGQERQGQDAGDLAGICTVLSGEFSHGEV